MLFVCCLLLMLLLLLFTPDVAGAQDGSVRLWEWGHAHCIAVARQPGTFPKVTKVLFNAQGNKVGPGAIPTPLP